MSVRPASQQFFSVLISTRPHRDALSRPLLAAIFGHAVIVGALIITTDAHLPVIVTPRAADTDEPPILIRLVDPPAARATRAAPAARSGVRRPARAQLSAAPNLALPDLSDVEAALAVVSDSMSRVITAGAWAMPDVPRREDGFVDLATLARAPRFTAYSRAPSLINRKDIQKFLSRRFPFRLRQLGGEARAMLWLLIDTSGHVHKAQVSQTSGRIDVDSIALASTNHMLFQPAEHAGRTVPVWVQMPVGFRVLE